MVAKLEDLSQSLYFHFSSSPKHHLEFTKLVEMVEIGSMILWNVNIQWISMLELLTHVMVEYKTLIVKMSHNVLIA
jgi:hypothetical protein